MSTSMKNRAAERLASAKRASRTLTHASDDGTVAGLMRSIVDPLCEETAQLLRPHKLRDTDRLMVDVDENDPRYLILRPYALVNDQKVDASFAARNDWLECIPERESISHDRWRVGGTDITCLVINANWAEDKLEMSEEARARYRYLLTRFLSQTLVSQHRANFKLRGHLPELPEDWHDSEENPLAPYQTCGTFCMLGQEGSALFAEQGTGKTPMAWRRICIEAHRHYEKESAAHIAERRKRQLFRVLVVAPKNVRYNWQSEAHRFCTVPGNVTVLAGGMLERTKLLIETITPKEDDDAEFAVCIISYEGLRRSWDLIRMVHWHQIYLDEAHYIKSPYAERTKKALELPAISDARTAMTGTPITNKIRDLYTQLEFLGEGMSGFISEKKFRDFYEVYEKAGQYEKLVGFQNLPFLQERLARIAFMITKKEALPFLPKKNYSLRTVEMTSEQRAWYIKLQTQLMVEIEGGVNSDGRKMTATHILVKLLRLAQVTSGFASWDPTLDPTSGDVIDPRKVTFTTPNPKLEELMAVIKESGPEEKIIVWACFLPDIMAIKDRLDREGIPSGTFTGGTSDEDRQLLEKSFNCEHARDMKVFIGNPAAGGTGLNLRGYDPDTAAPGVNVRIRHAQEKKQTAKEIYLRRRHEERFAGYRFAKGLRSDHGCNCTKVVYYSQNWSMVYRCQSEDRAHRRGTRVPVEYIDIVVPGTIDEEIRARVMGKQMKALQVQDVREVMKRVLSTIPEDDSE